MQTLLGLPRRFSVAGQIHSSPMEGPGITLRLWDQGALCGATTIWRGSPNVNGAATIDDFRELVVPAAAWLQHELATVLDSDHTARSTTSVSYALLAAGIEAQRHGDQARAQIWFQRSLSVDPTHLRARVALALGYDQASDNYTDAEAYLLSTLFMDSRGCRLWARDAGPGEQRLHRRGSVQGPDG